MRAVVLDCRPKHVAVVQMLRSYLRQLGRMDNYVCKLTGQSGNHLVVRVNVFCNLISAKSTRFLLDARSILV